MSTPPSSSTPRPPWAPTKNIREKPATIAVLVRQRPGAIGPTADDGDNTLHHRGDDRPVRESGRARWRRLQGERIAAHLDGLGFAEQCGLLATLSPRQRDLLDRLTRGGRRG